VLVELGVVEQRYRAVLEVLDEGVPVTVVSRRYGVARQTVHEWLRRYAGEGGLGALADRSSRPGSCPLGCPAFSGQVNWCYFTLPAAGSGTRRGLPAESYSRALSEDVYDCTGARCTLQYPRLLFSLSGRWYGRPARL
jgi:Helix-turn-helix domain